MNEPIPTPEEPLNTAEMCEREVFVSESEYRMDDPFDWLTISIGVLAGFILALIFLTGLVDIINWVCNLIFK